MSLTLLRFLAMTVGPSITAAARPAVTFLGVQLVVAALVAGEMASLPEQIAWLVSVPAIIVAAVLAGLETAAKHDPDIAAILRDLQIDNMTGAFGAFSAALLFAALGMPDGEAAALAAGDAPVGGDGGLLDATAAAASSDLSTEAQVGVVGGGVALNLGLTWLRSEILEFVDDFELGKLWARLETGGVVGLLILLPLLPLVALAALVLFAVVLSGFALTARAAQHALDQRRRVECANCDYRVRVEASLCPKCRTAREPEAEPSSGVGAAWRALRKSPAGS